MDSHTPNIDVLKAFGLSGEPRRLSGGQGTTYRFGNAVLKPIDNIDEASWVADLNTRLVSDAFRVPKPIKADNGSWVWKGWIASEFIEGAHEKNLYTEAITISQEFHGALKSILKPSFIDQKDNVWAVADRIAWGEQPFPDFALTAKYFQKVSSLFKPIESPCQLIHGDWGLGNILFTKDDKPAVIDFSPYWRPADFAIAIMIIDALAYENARPTIVDLCAQIKQFDQLLLRALTRRICEYIGHQNHPKNTKDRTKDILIHLNIFAALLAKKSVGVG